MLPSPEAAWAGACSFSTMIALEGLGWAIRGPAERPPSRRALALASKVHILVEAARAFERFALALAGCRMIQEGHRAGIKTRCTPAGLEPIIHAAAHNVLVDAEGRPANSLVGEIDEEVFGLY